MLIVLPNAILNVLLVPGVWQDRCFRVRQILSWSLPLVLESAATLLAMVVTGMVSSSYGADAVAVQRVSSQIESISWLVGVAYRRNRCLYW